MGNCEDYEKTELGNRLETTGFHFAQDKEKTDK